MWLLFLLAQCFTGAVIGRSARRELRQRPGLIGGYPVLMRICFFWLNLPWMVMGLGCTVGHVEDGVFGYARPGDGNPWVLAFYVTLVALGLLNLAWVFLGGGDEFLVRHRPLLGPYQNRVPPTARGVRLLAALSFAGGIAAMTLLSVFSSRYSP
jgi:hypothetical protein